MLWIAAGSAVSSALIGTYISYHLDGSTGACIVLTQAGFFVAAMFGAPRHGVLARRRLRRAQLAA
jgi:ABC-type Mn2+/Zn2+ transport system permease subunit